MALRFYIQQSSYNNLLTNFIGKQNKLTGPRNLVRRLDVGSNKTPTFFETLTPLLIPPPIKSFFIKFIKTFIKSI